MNKYLKMFLPRFLGGWSFNVWNLMLGHVNGYVNFVIVYDSREILWNWIREHPVITILEVGLGDGKNMLKMIELAGKHYEYYCFDNLSGFNSKTAYEKVKDVPHTHFYIGDSLTALRDAKLPDMDLIFIDGAHDYLHTKSDWLWCRKLMLKNSVCFFHDLHKPEVMKAIKEIDKRKYKVEIIPTETTDTIFGKVTIRG